MNASAMLKVVSASSEWVDVLDGAEIEITKGKDVLSALIPDGQSIEDHRFFEFEGELFAYDEGAYVERNEIINDLREELGSEFLCYIHRSFQLSGNRILVAMANDDITCFQYMIVEIKGLGGV
jgi:hypothetical protein